MDKISVVVSSPVDTYSGYGARSRDFIKALLKLEKYDVKLLSQRWGATRFGYLEDHEEHEMKSLIIPKMTSQPDIWIQVTVPNEFQKVGKFNIGVTAGIETTICDGKWIEGMNRMDLNLVSSKHAKEVFQTTKYKQTDSRTKQVVGSLEITSPIEVLFEGVDLDKYFKITKKSKEGVSLELDTIPESWCYLFVGHWLKGNYRHDRKNIGWMIHQFLETYKNKKGAPALILKTQHANASISDKENLIKKVNEIRKKVKGTLPNIYILHGELYDSEINELYNHPKVKAMVNLTRGEGFGRPLLEFSLTGKPIVASGWSGHVDFLAPEYTSLVGGVLETVDKSSQQEGIILKDAKWFQADEAQTRFILKDLPKNYKKYEENAKRLAYQNKKDFSFEAMTELLGEILDKRVPNFPKQVQLSMPQGALPTLTLPKLQ